MDDLFNYAAHHWMIQRTFTGAWYPMTVAVVYIVCVVYVGPKIMKNRKAYDLKEVIRIYNLINIVCNALYFVSAMFITNFLTSCWFCQPNNVSPVSITFGGFSYMHLKVFDLLDTVFFILRKKNNQISFLHVSHHAIMPFTTWVANKYAPMLETALLPAINSFVHVIMYTYYYKASQGVQLNWIKQYITLMQLVQFVIISIHAAHLILMPNCDYPKWIACFTLAHGLFFMYTFSEFYRKAYSKKPKSLSNEVNNNNAINEKIRKNAVKYIRVNLIICSLCISKEVQSEQMILRGDPKICRHRGLDILGETARNHMFTLLS